MRYLVTARVKPGRRPALDRAIENGTLGAGSIAGDEYSSQHGRRPALARWPVKWVETCFCATPLAEERPYWEDYFDLLSVKDAHARSRCRHENGTEYWACSRLRLHRRSWKRWLEAQGEPFRSG